MSDSKATSHTGQDWGLCSQSIANLSGAKLETVLKAAQKMGVTDPLAALPNDAVVALFSTLGFELTSPPPQGGAPFIIRHTDRSIFFHLIFTPYSISLADRPDVPQDAEMLDYLQFLQGLEEHPVAAPGFEADRQARTRIVTLAAAARRGDKTSLERLAVSTIEAVRVLAEVETHQPRLFQDVMTDKGGWPLLISATGKLLCGPSARSFLGKAMPIIDTKSKVKLSNPIGRVALQLVTYLHAYRELARKWKAVASLRTRELEPGLALDVAALPDFGPETAKHWIEAARKAFQASYPDTSNHPVLKQLAKARGHRHFPDAWSNVAKRIAQLAARLD